VVDESVSETVEEVVVRTPSVVAEAMSKSLPDSRATSSTSSGQASPAAEVVETATHAVKYNNISEDFGTTTDAEEDILDSVSGSAVVQLRQPQRTSRPP